MFQLSYNLQKEMRKRPHFNVQREEDLSRLNKLLTEFSHSFLLKNVSVLSESLNDLREDFMLKKYVRLRESKIIVLYEHAGIIN